MAFKSTYAEAQVTSEAKNMIIYARSAVKPAIETNTEKEKLNLQLNVIFFHYSV